MEAMETILTRRSIRHYTDQSVSPELITRLLRAAMQAPSASNKQPWYFVVIDDRQILDKVPEFHPYSNMLWQAPLAIAVCANSEAQPLYWTQDCAAATENILLAAHAEGLGAVWLAIYPREERVRGLKILLGLPDNIMPLSLISVGYPSEKKMPEDRYDPSRVHNNHW